MAENDPKKLDEFLSKVDQIESLVKGLKNADAESLSSAMKAADDVIAKYESGDRSQHGDADDEDLPKTKTGFSKTFINTSSPDAPVDGSGAGSTPFNTTPGMMLAMEKDAEERAANRSARQKEANIIKEKGNEEFKKGNYEKALEYYTEALNTFKDNTVLWTNRAQTLIKLGRFEEAVSDCDWALRVFENCIKGHIHMGRAYLGLKQFDKARECYQKALKCDPQKENLIKDYLAEVDRVEKANTQEQNAKELFDSGDMEAKGVVDLIEKVRKTDQLPLYYGGGFRVIAQILKNDEERTLFRTNGGLALLSEHPLVSRCLSASPRSLSQEELDMLSSVMDLVSAACQDNETSQQQVMQTEGLTDKLLRFMEVKIKGQGRVMKASCVNFLHTLSVTEAGRASVLTSFDMPRLLTVLFTLIRTNASVANNAASVLNNLALDKRFKAQVRDRLEETVLPAFENLIKEGNPRQLSAVPSCITTVTNLSGDKVIRLKVAQRKELWEACVGLLTKHRTKLEDRLSVEIVEATAGLLINISSEPCQSVREFGVSICQSCLALCQAEDKASIMMHGLCLMGNILPHSIPAVDWASDNRGPEIFMAFIMSEAHEKQKTGLRCLTSCTQLNDTARNYIVDNKGLGLLVKLLKKEDEVIVGNAALCLSHCTQVPKVCAALVKTDIIKELLVLARDGKRPTVQQNCAILIAKLAQGDSRHLERLRELHGIEILHSCMKYIK